MYLEFWGYDFQKSLLGGLWNDQSSLLFWIISLFNYTAFYNYRNQKLQLKHIIEIKYVPEKVTFLDIQMTQIYILS